MSIIDESGEIEGYTHPADRLEPALRYAFGSPPKGTAEKAGEPISREALAAGGRYSLREEIGRGGMGMVFRAEDGHLNREVAIKVLSRRADDAERAGRFAEEARIAAQLQHPGIVPIHDLGTITGQPFITMKLVSGRTLHEELTARRGAPEGRATAHHLGILEQVAQAAGFAHERGVVHRDLKPANVMLGPAGEVQVMDWGLAKVVGGGDPVREVASRRNGDPRLVSLAGRVMGTPAYMAPEQARGEVAAVDRRSDVFALGAMLSEILLGKPVYRGATSDEVRRQAAAAATGEVLDELEQGGFEPELVARAHAGPAIPGLCPRPPHGRPPPHPHREAARSQYVPGTKRSARSRATPGPRRARHLPRSPAHLGPRSR